MTLPAVKCLTFQNDPISKENVHSNFSSEKTLEQSLERTVAKANDQTLSSSSSNNAGSNNSWAVKDNSEPKATSKEEAPEKPATNVAERPRYQRGPNKYGGRNSSVR